MTDPEGELDTMPKAHRVIFYILLAILVIVVLYKELVLGAHTFAQ